jgi:hypothetical protein
VPYLRGRLRASFCPLSRQNLPLVLCRLLPRASNYRSDNYDELLGELRHFGVLTKRQLRSLVLKYRHEAMRIDRAPLDALNLRIFRKEWGDTEVAERLRTGTWFTWAGLIHIILELKFGDSYRQFANERDQT